jgi:putative SOS response-associated peptidase YedK
MCGRFTNHLTWQQIHDLYRLSGGPPASNFRPRYNIAPTQSAFVVRLTDGQRELVALRWGLVPFWAKDSKGASRLINAQSESCATKPAFRAAFKSRRCLVVADGFFEWPEKHAPRLIALKDGAPFAFAGLWESWGPKTGDRLETFTILTTTPNAFMAEVHHRMPVILPPEAWSTWLGENAPSDNRLLALCAPFPAERMTAWRVSARVGNVRNDDPSLIEPIDGPARLAI